MTLVQCSVLRTAANLRPDVKLTPHKYVRLRSAVIVLCASALACMSGAASANDQLVEPGDIAPFEVEYEVGNHLINAGTAQLSLTEQDGLWTYSLSTKPRGILKIAGKGKINEVSTFTLEQAQGKLMIQPQNYTFRQDDERRRAVDATFNWAEKSVTHSYRGKQTTESFDEPIIDRLSSTLLMMNALRGSFVSAELVVVDTGRQKKVAFENIGTELLNTPLGKIETVRVLNQNAGGGSRQTITWFAPSLDYVPVKIEHRKRGELVARMNLLKLTNQVKNISID